ncbi:hypothetical protein ACQ4PT_049524 [Festuca glaucescens]
MVLQVEAAPLLPSAELPPPAHPLLVAAFATARHLTPTSQRHYLAEPNARLLSFKDRLLSGDENEEGIILESLNHARDAVLECAVAVADKGSKASPDDGALQDVAREVAGWLGGLAVLFEEDNKDPRIWFHVHNYHESNELVVGWHGTGPKLKD